MKGFTLTIASVAALGGLLFGFDTAVIAGTIQYLKNYFDLTSSSLGLVVAAASIGCIPGALIAGRLADRFGRAALLRVSAICYIVAALGSGAAWSFGALVGFRFIGGIAIGMASTVAPIYISEIAPPRFRGRLGMMQQLAIVLGILVSFISNYWIVRGNWHGLDAHNYWRFMLGIAFVPSVIFFLLLLAIPESPRWLVARGNLEKSRKIFARIYSEELAPAQVSVVREDLATHQDASLKEILSKRYRKVLLIGLVFASIAQLTGINIIFYYAPLIFEKTQVHLSVLLQTLLTGIVNLVFTLLAFTLIDRIGRKMLLLAGSAVMGVCMGVIGWMFYRNALDNYVVLVLVFVYIAGFASTWGAVLWVYVAEIFPNRIRGTATSIAVFGNWTANSIVSFTFPVMLSGLGGARTFWIYGIINLCMIAFVGRYVFETKGVPLEEVEQLYVP
ncbi:MAG TPA: sugar porter family MFS transporter [Chitinophagaceae bacterium]|nr:sugar porter family MFS transporter [Chitinophagaceae bacterium]